MRYALKRAALIAILGFGALLAFVAYRDADLGSALVIAGATVIGALAVLFLMADGSRRKSRGFTPNRKH